MDLSRLRSGELIAAAGGIVLLIALLFLNWYSVGGSVETGFGEISVGADFGAWDGQGFSGTIANLIILAAGIGAVGLAVLTATSRTVALPVATSAVSAGLGIAAVVMVLLRMLFQPGPNEIVDLEIGIFVALAGALAVAYGGWQSMKEEGTTFANARDQLQGRTESAPGPVAPGPVAPAPPPDTSTGADAPSTSMPPPGGPGPGGIRGPGDPDGPGVGE